MSMGAAIALFFIGSTMYFLIGAWIEYIMEEYTTIIDSDDYALSISVFWPIVVLIVGIGEICRMCKEIFGKKKEK